MDKNLFLTEPYILITFFEHSMSCFLVQVHIFVFHEVVGNLGSVEIGNPGAPMRIGIFIGSVISDFFFERNPSVYVFEVLSILSD